MKADQILLVVFLNVGLFPVNAWDVAVAVEDQIQFLNKTGTLVGKLSEGMTEVCSLAYNEELKKMYFGDNARDDGSIFELTVPDKMDPKNESVQVHTVLKKQVYQVKGMAYDVMTGILYWSTGQGHTILWVRVNRTGEPQVDQQLIRINDQIFMGLAIDNCKRYLYWTNCGKEPSIERSMLDGSQRHTLTKTDLVLPYAVVVDQSTDRLYWVDERHGAEFRIESSDLNGKDRKVLIEGSDHQPFALAVIKSNVYWADHIHTSVWQLPLDTPYSTSSTVPELVSKYSTSPLALVSSYSGHWSHERCNPVIEPTMKVIPATVTMIASAKTTAVSTKLNSSQPFCLHNGIWVAEKGYCNCLPGFSGALCEVNECLDYCMHGHCHADTQGPTCQCAEGYTGERCQLSVCHNYCVTGSCSIDLTGQPQCHCQEGYAGQRCEVNFTQQQELRDNLQEVCKAFCTLWAQSSKENIQPFDVCSCVEFDVMVPMDSDWSYNYMQVVPTLVCIILIIAVGILTWKVVVLRKRPRIKKRIIVNKSVTPLTCRPNSADGDQCEITIENCCNMNICETPCFEPDFRQPQATLTKSNNRGAKEEKKTLLGNMELPPDDLY